MAGEIFPHGRPEAVADGVWVVKGSLPFPLFRNMVVLRLPTGELVLHSVVALDEAGMQAIAALGTPTYAIVPSLGHQRDGAFWHEKLPGLKFLAPAAIQSEAQKRVPIAGSVEEVLPPLGFVLHGAPGSKLAEYVYEWPVPTGGRVLVFNDLLASNANWADESKIMGNLVLRHLGPQRRLDIARIYRLSTATDVPAIRRFAASLAATPGLRAVTVSHGDPITHDPAGALRAVAD